MFWGSARYKEEARRLEEAEKARLATEPKIPAPKKKRYALLFDTESKPV